MKKRKISPLFFAILFISSGTFCQQTINASSNSSTINGLRFDYSIGEMTLIQTDRNANIIVTQGFLQPLTNNLESSSSGSSTQTPPITQDLLSSDNIKVYPNPTENILNVESIEFATTTIRYQLFDGIGKLLINESLIWQAGPNKFLLDLKSYAAGTYYLMISKPNTNNKIENLSFKIQKTN